MSIAITLDAPSITTADIVAANIRAEAARLGYTQVEFGKAIGLSQSAVTKRWNGITPWQLAELDSAADALGVTVADLVSEPARISKATQQMGGFRGRLPRLDSNQQPAD